MIKENERERKMSIYGRGGRWRYSVIYERFILQLSRYEERERKKERERSQPSF